MKTTYTLMEFGGDDRGVWECSKCGIAWNLEADGPAENHMNYCPHCGRRIVFIVSHGERKLMGAEYDEKNPHCRECECPNCIYFYRNSGDCREACEECDGESHVRSCPMFGDLE